VFAPVEVHCCTSARPAAAAGVWHEKIRLSFGTKAEPLLWLADAVAGAVATDLTGDPRFVEILAPHLTHVVTRGVP
jgi:hypothetical protein